jgi:hypothetical protein
MRLRRSIEVMNRRVVVILAALVSAAAAAATLAAQSPARLIVAYLTTDRELVPVARYDGTSWTNTWPEPIPADAPLPVRIVADIPRTWLGQPVPLTWTAWFPGTGKQRVTVTGVDRADTCAGAITLTTSLRADLRSEGLAFDRAITVDAIVRLEETSPEWDALRAEVVPHFGRAIVGGASPQPGRDPGEWGVKVLALARADNAAGTARLASVLRNPRLPVYYIEAERRYDGIPADTDNNALSYGGWFRKDRAGVLTPIDASLVSFSTADEKLPRYTPIGIFRHGERSIWVMSEWGKESQTIVLFEVSADGVRKLTSADIVGC